MKRLASSVVYLRRLWHELIARPPEKREAAPTGEPLAVEVLDRFLNWRQKNRAAETYRWHKYFFKSLSDSLPAGLPVSGLKPYHLTEVMDAQADWGYNSKHNFVTAINRAFNWARKQEIIDRNPVPHTEKPARAARAGGHARGFRRVGPVGRNLPG